MDTTLRDGEQTHGVSFTAVEKLAIAKKLLEVGVSRIEVGNARVSKGEQDAVVNIVHWAKESSKLQCIEVLGFIDNGKSIDWIKETGCKTMNLLCKGSLKHVELQLNKTQDEHISDVQKIIKNANSNGMIVNAYLEDWSNGIQDSPYFVYKITKALIDSDVKRVMLPDTLGIFGPDDTKRFVKLMTNKFPDTHFDFHAHNDYGLGTANSLAAVQAGAKGVHVTVNYLGERTGNATLDEVAIAIKDILDIDPGIDGKKLKELSRIVETFSGKRISDSKPITGEDVFTQTAGIHADGDKKGGLYTTRLSPARFNRERFYSLGKLSGRSSLDMNLQKLNINLTEEQKKIVLEKVIELGDKKKNITIEDLPFIISDILKTPEKRDIEILDYEIISRTNKKPNAKIVVKFKDSVLIKEADGDGGYNAFMNCLKKMVPEFSFNLPKLIDYNIRIPPGGKTDAIVQASITWKENGSEFKTIGVDPDQVVAAIKATEKMLNIITRNHQMKSNQDI